MSRETGFEPDILFDTKVSVRDSDGLVPLGLAVLGPTGFATYPLTAGQPRVVGRDPQADIVVDDPSVSRRHARVYVGDVIEIEDLGSSNGTYVRGARLKSGTRVQVGIGESFRVGDQVLLVQRVQVATGKPRRVHRGDYLEARLDEECARGTRFAYIKLRVEPATTGALDRVAAELNPADILAVTGAGEYGVLILEASHAEADDVAERLLTRLRGDGHSAQVGVACHPRDGRSLATILDAAERALLGRDASTGGDPGGVVVSPRLRQIYTQVDRVAAGDIGVLILGETGAGKDMLAQHVHQASKRAAGPFVRINCAALAESLVESELFGHEKGAFTGATGAKLGLLETARGGTVFLDEVGEIPMGIQAKLLQVIEQKQVLRVGGLTPHPIDVRFVAATNRDLERESERGAFRQDLYFRLAGFTVMIPPLRERRDEILPLAMHFLARVQPPTTSMRFSSETEELLCSYSWPGNVRELRHVIERAVLLCSGSLVTPDHLPTEKMRSTLVVSTPPTPAPADNEETLPPLTPDKQKERDRILELLTEVGGNQSEAARRLGISRSTLITRIEEYGLRRPRKRS